MSRKSGMGVGLSTMLVVLAVLCITAFSVLALQSVRSDRTLGENAAQAAQAWYAADAEAERLLGEIHGAVKAGLPLPPEAEGEVGGIVRYTVPVDENRELQAAVDTAGGQCRVVEWVTVPTGDWTPDTILELY